MLFFADSASIRLGMLLSLKDAPDGVVGFKTSDKKCFDALKNSPGGIVGAIGRHVRIADHLGRIGIKTFIFPGGFILALHAHLG